jgi:hypothetical protein
LRRDDDEEELGDLAEEEELVPLPFPLLEDEDESCPLLEDEEELGDLAEEEELVPLPLLDEEEESIPLLDDEADLGDLAEEEESTPLLDDEADLGDLAEEEESTPLPEEGEPFPLYDEPDLGDFEEMDPFPLQGGGSTVVSRRGRGLNSLLASEIQTIPPPLGPASSSTLISMKASSAQRFQ